MPGESQLARLRLLDELKIDKSFIDALGTVHGALSHTLEQAIIEVAATSGLEVVAEGIERPEQLAVLEGLACPLGQGCLFSRPVPAADVLAQLVTRRARTS